MGYTPAIDVSGGHSVKAHSAKAQAAAPGRVGVASLPGFEGRNLCIYSLPAGCGLDVCGGGEAEAGGLCEPCTEAPASVT
jgi:hypothetical protein